MGPAKGCRIGFRHAEVLHLARLDEVLDDARHLLDGHLWIHPMLIEEIDGIDPQPPEGGFRYFLDVRWPAVHAAPARPIGF